MYIIKRSRNFETSSRCLSKGGKFSAKEKFNYVIKVLVTGEHLPWSFRDHKLTGSLEGYRECHIQGDLLLIYKRENNILYLIDIGSHSQLFG
ncbi:MAG: type II toxin-antitoxin system YafQ family toxin [Candidatus Paceibacterota bacterium]|jgi:mRNA interferase YafQ